MFKKIMYIIQSLISKENNFFYLLKELYVKHFLVQKLSKHVNKTRISFDENDKGNACV